MRPPRTEWERVTGLRPFQGQTELPVWPMGIRPGELWPHGAIETGQCPLFHDWPTKVGLEASVFFLASMLPGVREIERSILLSIDSTLHDADQTGAKSSPRWNAGTADLACSLGIGHPIDPNGQMDQLRTSLLINFVSEWTDQLVRLAISVQDVYPVSAREIDLLLLEREYWRSRGVYWLVITLREIHRHVHRHILTGAPMALARWRATRADLDCVRENARRLKGLHQGAVYAEVAKLTGRTQAQAVFIFWQAVWSGDLCMDLRQPNFLTIPLHLVSSCEFRAFNPLRVQRSHELASAAVTL